MRFGWTLLGVVPMLALALPAAQAVAHPNAGNQARVVIQVPPVQVGNVIVTGSAPQPRVVETRRVIVHESAPGEWPARDAHYVVVERHRRGPWWAHRNHQPERVVVVEHEEHRPHW